MQRQTDNRKFQKSRIFIKHTGLWNYRADSLMNNTKYRNLSWNKQLKWFFKNNKKGNKKGFNWTVRQTDFSYRNGCRIYVDDITGENFLSIYVAFSPPFYWLGVYSVRGEGWGKGRVGKIVTLARYRVYFSYIEHENLV